MRSRTPSQQLDRDQTAGDVRLEALERCRQQLPEAQRHILHRRYGQDQSDHHIAEETGRSVAAIHKTLVRIRAALRRCVEQRLNQGSVRDAT